MKIKKKVVTPKQEEVFAKCHSRISEIEAEIFKLQEEREQLLKDILEMKISPFKIGDYAMADIKIGRSVKNQKCLLECDNGTLYLRPFKNDGTLADRHFSCIPIPNKSSYSDLLRKVGE